MNFTGFTDCPEWSGDKAIKLNELLQLVKALQKKYGKDAKIMFNAGHNNVMVLICATKDIK
jgi:hypothetical protein